MKFQSADSRKRIEIIGLLAITGLLMLSGCASTSTADHKSAAWTGPSQATGEIAVPANTERAPSPPSCPSVRLVSDESTPAAVPPPTQRSTGPQREVSRTTPRPEGGAIVRTVSHANEATFEQQVLRSDVPVLVDFYASWCGPCKKLAPTLEEVAAESPQAKVVKVNIDDSPELAARYGVESIPSLLVFKDGQIVAKQQGVASKTRVKSMLDL